MDRWLGEPLPHQLSNPTRAHPCAINLWYQNHAIPIRYAVLASVSGRYPPHKGRLLTRYSPVRHWSEDRSPRHRSTWMCYARRQRSSWARIKLSKTCIISPFRALQSFSSFCSSFYFYLSCITLLNCRDSTSHFLFALYLISFVVQFSMTGFAACRGPSRYLSRGDSTIISHLVAFVNTFFKTFLSFFGFFSKLLFRSLLGSLSRAPPQTACILYYLFLLLSIPFLKVFEGFLHFVYNAQIPLQFRILLHQ